MKVKIKDTPATVKISTLSRGEAFHRAGNPNDVYLVINQNDTYISDDTRLSYINNGFVICVCFQDGELISFDGDDLVVHLYNLTADYNPS